MKNTSEALVVGSILAGTGFLVYKLCKIMFEAEKEREAEREKLEQTIRDEIVIRDYKNRIRKVSLYNENLDPHQRNIAIDILEDFFQEAQDAESLEDFEITCEKIEDLIDILGSGNKDAILALLDRRIRAEESRKTKALREHELAMAKALGEKDINIAKISAEAEKAKASLYSKGITGAATILKEVANERNEKSED